MVMLDLNIDACIYFDNYYVNIYIYIVYDVYIYMVPPPQKSTFFMGKGGNVLEI